MTSDMIECLHTLGVDWSRTLDRFLDDEKMYIKFLIKFSVDEQRKLLLDSVSCGDKVNIEIAAHTLKGVSSNLGLEKLQDIYSQIVSQMRGKGETAFDILMEEERQAYQDFKDIAEVIRGFCE